MLDDDVIEFFRAQISLGLETNHHQVIHVHLAEIHVWRRRIRWRVGMFSHRKQRLLGLHQDELEKRLRQFA